MIDLGEHQKASASREEVVEFADIVGQAELKQALLAVATDDELDGLLIRGEKGTAKSTAVRALAGAFPEQRVVAGCPYGCPPDIPDRQCAECRARTDPSIETRPVPLVTLPLGATRERVTGTLSVADALDGQFEFDPGLLARANRGILYVDEVNLLDDHLVDLLLDAAATGVNRVERDGVSVSHPAEFTLVGTMNPEEGELRPQLRDRFALQTTVTGCADLDQRVEIIERALGTHGENEPPDHDEHDDRDDEAGRLRRARELLPEVTLSDAFVEEIAELCRDAGVEGHRADIATARAARAFAALDDRPTVLESDVRKAAELALAHRMRSRPFEEAPAPDDLLDDRFGEDEGEGSPDDTDDAEGGDRSDGADDDQTGEGDDRSDGDGESPAGNGAGGVDDAGKGDGSGDLDDRTDDGDGVGDEAGTEGTPGGDPSPERGDSTAAEGTGGDEPASVGADERATPLVPGQGREPAGVGDGGAPDLPVPEPDTGDGTGTGRAHTTNGSGGDGARVRTEPARTTDRVNVAASVRAAATRGASRVDSRDLRRSVSRERATALVLFVVDASASMRPAMRQAKGTLLELLKGSYQERDQVGFVSFAGDDATVLLPPTDSVTLAARHLKELPTGDRTPLPAGLRTAATVLERADPAASVVVLVTDGRANVATGSPVEETREAARQVATQDAEVVVVDAGDGTERVGLTDIVAEETNGRVVPLDTLSAGQVDAVVGNARESQL